MAANRLAELRLILTAKGTLQNGTLSVTEELAGRECYWWGEGMGTQLPGFFRYEITVADSEAGQDAPLHTLDGYLARETVNDRR